MAEHDGVHHQPDLVDEVGVQQLAGDRDAPGQHDGSVAVLVLQRLHGLDEVALDDRVFVHVGSVRVVDATTLRIELILSANGSPWPRRSGQAPAKPS